MNRKDDYIALFDSGVGGVSVLRQLVKLLPQEKYLYYGDSANAPYGTRSTEQVRQLSLDAAEKLMAQGIKALVVACNTATAAAIQVLRERYPDMIIIGIEPALKLAADNYPGGRIAVLATPVTLREEKFDTLRSRFAEDCQVYPIPAPGLVELIEGGHIDDAAIDAFLEELLRPYRGKLDAMVLGCTHYPFVAKAIARYLGDGVTLLDGGEGTARETRRRLEAAGLLGDGPAQIRFQSSSDDPNRIALAERLLDQP